jgi:hypothetical protein
MASGKKRSKSFKRCSRRGRSGCLRAKKTCSFRKNRTPRCRPKGYRAPTKKSKRKSGKKSGKKSRSKKSKTGVGLKVAHRSKKSDNVLNCQRFKTSKTCTKDAQEKYGVECAFDRRKIPMCQPKDKDLTDLSVPFSKLRFNIPITRAGIVNNFFVLENKPSGGRLYIRYSKALLTVLQSQYAKTLRNYFVKENREDRLFRSYVNAGIEREEADALSHKVGEGIALTDEAVAEYERLFDDNFMLTAQLDFLAKSGQPLPGAALDDDDDGTSTRSSSS